MASPPPIYDLMLLLSTTAEDEQRAKVLKSVESAISQAGGSIERDDDWGRRPTTYQIRHQSEAEYHLLQFTAPPSLIEELSHTLRITDGVLRVRVIKVARGTPDAPSSPPPVVAVAAPSAVFEPASSTAPAAEPVAEAVAEPLAEAVAEEGETAAVAEAEPSAGEEPAPDDSAAGDA